MFSIIPESFSLTSIRNLVNIIPVNLFGAKVVVPGSNGVIQLPVRSVGGKDDGIVTIFLMGSEVFGELIFRIKCMHAYIFQAFK